MASVLDDAFALIKETLRDWDLIELWNDVQGLMTEGVGGEVALLRIRDTESYKKRFAGNAARAKAGLEIMSEAEYLAVETSLKTVVRRFLGAGEYDTKDQIDKWIAVDMAPQELADRFGLYAQNFERQPQAVKDAWRAQGFSITDAIKVAGDPTVTESILRRRFTAAGIAGEAFQQYGSARYDESRFGTYVDAGVDADKAREGFGRVAAREEREGLLASLSGTELSREDQERSELLGDSKTTEKRRKVLDEEEARFSESYVGGQSSLARDISGSY